jgi:hypothetical protein
MSYAVKIKGLDKLNRKIRSLQGPELKRELRKTTEAANAYVLGQVPSYPSPPVGSTYRRTGTLGRSIGTEVRTIGSEIMGVIGSNVSYAPWVISDEVGTNQAGPQATVHKGRWYTLQDVVKKARDHVVSIYNDAISKLTKR